MFEFEVFENFLSETECDEILDFSMKNLELEIAMVGDETLNENVRKSKICFNNYYEKFPFLKEKINNKLNQIFDYKGYEINLETEFQFTKYNEGDYYQWHTDSSKTGQYSERHCSIVIQLNDEYEGGNLQIKNRNNKTETLKKGKGNMYVFLSNIRHRVDEVNKGTRYSLVNWFSLKLKENFKKTLI